MKKFLLSLSIAAMSISAAQAETVYFQEDFEWLEPYAKAGKNGNGEPASGNTIGTNGAESEAPKADACKVDDISALEAMQQKGYDLVSVYDFLNNKNKTDIALYLQQNYLKFNKTGKTTSNGKGFQLGLVLPSIKGIPEGKDVCVSFDWCPMKQGSGMFDKTELCVIVENGDDVRYVDAPVATWEDNADYEWKTAVVSLAGITVNDNTKLTIRTTEANWELTTAQRWFIDNIKVYSEDASSIDEIGIDMNAPVEYYNMLGIRVENPGNGLYIVKQGNKTAKKFIVR